MSIRELEILKRLLEKAEANKAEIHDAFNSGYVSGIYSCIKAIEKANNEEIEAMASLESASERLEGVIIKDPNFNSKDVKEFLGSMI